MSNCLFCKIINKEIPAEVVYEDDDAIGVLDVRPLAPGHVLVLPKNHAQDILAFEDKKIGLLFSAVKKITRLVNDAFSPDGFVIGVNNGRFSGHTTGVDHLHVHIIPRWKDDGGISLHGIVNNPPKESLEEIRKKILGDR